MLSRVQEAGITLKLAKCTFAQPKVKYLGHMVGSGTHQPDVAKIEAILNMEFPNSKKKLKSFLGLISYYRSYVRSFANIVKPLTDLTKAKVTERELGNPSADALKAFNVIKQILINPPVLCTPDFCLPFLLQTDASQFGVGCCLSQVQEGGERVVAYASAKLTGSQINWSTIEKEAFAVIFGLKKFDQFIYGREVIIESDHNPLAYLTAAIPHNPKLVRWRLALDRYNITKIQYKKGKLNGNADALSRLH